MKLNKIKRAVLIMFVFILYLMAHLYLEPFFLSVWETDIKSVQIPVAFNGKKIVFISDIHHGPHFSIGRVRSLVEKVNGLKPDIVLLGGDYVHGGSRYIKPCMDELKNLKAPLGVFGVRGNHDHWDGAELSKKAMVEAGIKLIENGSVWVGVDNQKIKLVGVGDLWEDTQEINGSLSDVSDTDFVILVSHNPDYAEKISPYYQKTDLMLSGHTHGGQVSVFGLYSPVIPSAYGQKYRSGTVQCGGMKLLISNGVGCVTPPVRFFCRPDIISITLKTY
ncbi:MAG TPA: metallophosphoesterase [Candidatus Wallbacteria bacterium]|nr:metallophosphoesterase [Candidatus Wallbacteria bacterium]